MNIPFQNSYARLPARFYSRLNPQPVQAPHLIQFNTALAQQLGLDTTTLDSEQGTAIFAGNVIPEAAEPLAMAYTGHQFGHFNPQLGDGRAILLGELLDNQGTRWDVQLKGSGRTPYSRGGDGRSQLGPVLREYILSEFMNRVGVPSTRALAAVTTGEQVVRDRLFPGGILTRLSRSYVRVGTFQYFAAQGDTEAVQTLVDYLIQRNFPDLAQAEIPWLALLQATIERQAQLIAQWMGLGFIHGVMNTDNASVSGETIDYGPCAFMEGYDPEKVFSSIDRQGRYAYQNQPAIAHWNLCRLAETFLPLAGEGNEEAFAAAQDAINTFPTLYKTAWLAVMRDKLGLHKHSNDEIEADTALAEDYLALMANHSVDFTLSFRHLSALGDQASDTDQVLISLFNQDAELQAWLIRWRQCLAQNERSEAERQQAMLTNNPLYIPRNHLVEAVIRAGEDENDFTPFQNLLAVLQEPFTAQDGRDNYAKPAEAEEAVLRTFCGT